MQMLVRMSTPHQAFGSNSVSNALKDDNFASIAHSLNANHNLPMSSNF